MLEKAHIGLAKDSMVYWRRPGTGRLIVGLHGFGDNGARMAAWLGRLHDGPVCAPDLPFHGQTLWQDEVLTAEDLAAFIREVMAREGTERITLAGLSWGGRMALHLLPLLEGQLHEVWIFAPDGIGTVAGWATDSLPRWSRRLLARTLRRPAWLLALARRLRRWGWLDRFSFRFVEYHFSNEIRAHRLLQTWLSLTYFPIRRRAIHATSVPIAVYLGDQDELIDEDRVRRFFGTRARINVLQGGHRMMEYVQREDL